MGLRSLPASSSPFSCTDAAQKRLPGMVSENTGSQTQPQEGHSPHHGKARGFLTQGTGRRESGATRTPMDHDVSPRPSVSALRPGQTPPRLEAGSGGTHR